MEDPAEGGRRHDKGLPVDSHAGASRTAAGRQALRLAYNCLSEGLTPQGTSASIRIRCNGHIDTVIAHTPYDLLRAIYTLDPRHIASVSLTVGGVAYPLDDIIQFTAGPLREIAGSALGSQCNNSHWEGFLFELADSARNETLALFERERFHSLIRERAGRGRNLFTELIRHCGDRVDADRQLIRL